MDGRPARGTFSFEAAANSSNGFLGSSLGHKDFALSLAADHLHGGIWLGFYGGGISYFADGHIQETYTAADGLGAGTVTNLQAEKDGTLWVATDSGLSRMKNGRFITLQSPERVTLRSYSLDHSGRRSFVLVVYPMWADATSRSEMDTLDCRSGQESGGEADGPPNSFRQRGRSNRVRAISGYRRIIHWSRNPWMGGSGSCLGRRECD